jgi:ElaB/YqjD/DUF883 family membrane-anchored ribosome-binding protein
MTQIQAAESLLSIITELRHLLLLNDFKSIKEEANNTITESSALCQKIKLELKQLQSEVNDALKEVETALSGSSVKVNTEDVVKIK